MPIQVLRLSSVPVHIKMLRPSETLPVGAVGGEKHSKDGSMPIWPWSCLSPCSISEQTESCVPHVPVAKSSVLEQDFSGLRDPPELQRILALKKAPGGKEGCLFWQE